MYRANTYDASTKHSLNFQQLEAQGLPGTHKSEKFVPTENSSSTNISSLCLNPRKFSASTLSYRKEFYSLNGGDVGYFGPICCWFRFSVSAKTHPSIKFFDSGNGGHEDLAAKAGHKIYVQVLVMFREPSMNLAVDVHTGNVTCKILVC